MPQNDSAVLTAAKGYIYTAPVNTAAPTPSQISSFDPVKSGNESQEISASGSPTGGTFTLSFDGSTTDAISYDATSSAVQSALEALTNIGSGNVIATGGPLPDSSVTVTFTGSFAGQDVALMTADDANLTGGSTPSMSVATTSEAWGFASIGHTARDELPVFGYDGGETETRGTWQNAVLREVVTEVASDYVTFNAHQFDDTGLGLYYATTNQSSTAGVFEVAEAPSGTVEKSLLIVIVDGDVSIAFHAPKVSIRREDSIELTVDEFAYMPLRATFVKSDSATYLFRWISEDTGINPA